MDKMTLTLGQIRKLAEWTDPNDWGYVRVERFVGRENGNGEIHVEQGARKTIIHPDGKEAS